MRARIAGNQHGMVRFDQLVWAGLSPDSISRHGPNLRWQGPAARASSFTAPPPCVPRLTRSDLERLFLRLLRSHKLPLPEFNAKVGPGTVDALYRAERLIVEIDSYTYRSDRPTFTARTTNSTTSPPPSPTPYEGWYAWVAKRPSPASPSPAWRRGGIGGPSRSSPASSPCGP